MIRLEELQSKKPNLYRVACELSTHEDPYRVLNALAVLLSEKKEGPEA